MPQLELDAIYRDGFLELSRKLPIKDNERVRVTIEVEPHQRLRGFAVSAWEGDPETLRRVAEDPEFGVEGLP